MRTAVVRIGLVLGAHDGPLARLLPLFRLGIGGRVGSGDQWMSWIHIDDVVELLSFALENETVSGVLNAVAPEAVTNSEFTAVLGRALGRPTPFPVPALALRIAFGEMAQLLLGSQRVRPVRAERLGFEFRYPGLSAALTNLCTDNAELIEREQWVPRPIEEVFPFFSDPTNLEKLTPDFLQFRVLKSSTSQIGEGTVIDYRLRLHGVPVSWRSRIEEWTPGRRFVDVQLRGPYSHWRHEHDFESRSGGTVVRDRVRYRVPFGAIGQLAAGWLVRRDVDEIFRYRRSRLDRLFPDRRAGSDREGRLAS
jgi:hypothetical protein